ncbi:MAG TPA: copper chaperone PCu(A)C [Candidatus Dormibacteraeota bacterium]|nr:copper chaperone PCu(A)C [Candidatus Dormibacteraeota bacterium]
MKRSTLLLACTLAASLPLGARAAAPSGIQVSAAWSRPALVTGVVYLTITNHGPGPDRLVEARSDVARTTQIHESTFENGMMMMHPVAAVLIPAGGAVTFQPGGYHIMLMGLDHELKAGQTFRCRLRFEHAGWITVESHVRQM